MHHYKKTIEIIMESNQENISLVDKMKEYSNDFNKQYVYGIDPFSVNDKPSQSNFIYFDEQWNK